MRKALLPLFRTFAPILSGPPLGSIMPIKVLYHSLLSRLKDPSSIANVQGHRMLLDRNDGLALSVFGIYEPFETALLKKELGQGDVFVDIGAHIGYYTLIAARAVGGGGRVYAFEPDLANFDVLGRNVELNGYRNVVLEQKAVSSRTGSIKLFMSRDNLGDHRIYDSQDGRTSIDIDCVRLDDYFRDHKGRIDFVKMDIQGAEAGAIEGMLELLQRAKKIKLVSEFWPLGLSRFGADPKDHLETLSSLDFKVFEINEAEKRMRPADFSRMLQRCTIENERYTNLFCVKGS